MVDLTGQPMVFGVFAARKDTPVEVVQAAHQALLKRLDAFEKDPLTREKVLLHAHLHSDMSLERLNRYFGEVFNRLDAEHVDGLQNISCVAVRWMNPFHSSGESDTDCFNRSYISSSVGVSRLTALRFLGFVSMGCESLSFLRFVVTVSCSERRALRFRTTSFEDC